MAQQSTPTDFDIQRKFQPKQLQEDFVILRNALEEAHPGLYRFTHKKILDADFGEAFKLLNREMTEMEFYKVITFILSRIKDGHTKSLPSSDFMDYLSAKAKTFPLKLRFINGSAYVIAVPDNHIPRGSELLSINGKKMSEVTRILFEHLISDGDVETSKYWELNEKFGFYYYLFIEQSDSFSIEYFDRIKKLKRKASVSGIIDNKTIDSDQKPLRIKFLLEQNSAILTIKTFAADEINQAGQDYPNFLKSSFDEIIEKKIQNLIIDLRGNDGGRDSFGSLLFSYLTDKEFKYYDYLETSTNKISFLQYTNIDSNFSKMFEGYATPSGSGKFRVKESNHPNLKLQQPQKNHFDGKVWFLVNGQCFSTTAEFCSIAHLHRRGTFIGEEIGGNYYGNTSGIFLILTLPNTKVRILVPLVKYVLAVSGYPHSRRGLMPDFTLQPNVQDILNGIDTELVFTLKLISG